MSDADGNVALGCVVGFAISLALVIAINIFAIAVSRVMT